MLNAIWRCSSVSVVDVPDHLYTDILKLIDSHFSSVSDLDGDWRDYLVPSFDGSIAERTFKKKMLDLLVGTCRNLAENRVKAIKNGRSVSRYLQLVQQGTESLESIKPKIEHEIKAAQKSGLTSNVLCNMWLFDVGVVKKDWEAGGRRGKIDVPRFLNRCLGLTLSKQRVLTEYFLKCLEREITNAKNAGAYDVGIKTFSGNRIQFVGKPRSFCFRGLAAKDEHVCLYKVALDLGMGIDAALELYNKAKDTEQQPSMQDQQASRGQESELTSGFYVDDRTYLR